MVRFYNLKRELNEFQAGRGGNGGMFGNNIPASVSVFGTHCQETDGRQGHGEQSAQDRCALNDDKIPGGLSTEVAGGDL